ncbi:MAG: TapB family protein [Bacteroidia bacterium]
MKKIGYLLMPLALAAGTAFTISENICKSYFPQRVGTTLEYTSYNDKDKVAGKNVQKVKSVKNIANGVEVDMYMEMYDDKDKLANSAEYKMRCEGDKYYVDMSNLMTPESRNAGKNMEMEMQSSYLEFPTNPKAGQTLPDGSMEVKMKMDGTPVMTMVFNVTERKIEGFEDVTTPAGTFKCMKYSDRTEVKSLFSIKSKNTSWVAEDIGTIKTESYNDKGKLMAKMLLTKYQK